MIIRLELPELKELISLLRRSSNNLNQIARQVNATGRLYGAEMEQILQNQQQLWEGMRNILVKLAEIK